MLKVEALRFLTIKDNNNWISQNSLDVKKYRFLIFTDYREKFTRFQLKMIFNSEIYKNNRSDIKVTIKEHPAKRGYVKSLVDSNIIFSDLEPEYLIEKNDYIFAPYSSAVANRLA